MAHLLHIDSSARRTRSVSRELSALFASTWREAHPDGTYVYRDLAAEPLPHLTEATVEAMFVPLAMRSPQQQSACWLQEQLIAELQPADTLVIGCPMYNLSIPSTLKSWIDHVVIFGRTVGMGLFDKTRTVIVSGRGGAYGPGSPHEAAEHEEHYLQDILAMIGITDVTLIHADLRAAADGDPSLAHHMPAAEASIVAAREAVIASARGETAAVTA